MFKILSDELKYWVAWIIRGIPGETGIFIRARMTPCVAGSGLRIKEGVVIEKPSRLKIGMRVEINRNTIINAGGGVEIGDDTLIGPGVLIYSQNHEYHLSGTISSQGYVYKKVIIGANVWIAAHSIILPGVKIGDNTVIAAGSIITKNVPAGCICKGVAAKHSFRVKNSTPEAVD